MAYNPSASMIVARRYVIRGRVQGVGFRFFVQASGAREGLTGYVRNLPDGRVETAIEGDMEAVERFERAIYQGPRGAIVENVECHETAPTGRTTGFIVRR
jgi:acylphosphatase